jgi:hypothetical protein
MHDNKNIDGVREVSLDDLVSGITNHNKLLTVEARIKALEIAGDRLAFLMLNGTTTEMKKAIWEWRELNPRKENERNS